jgi:hypothetical protein
MQVRGSGQEVQPTTFRNWARSAAKCIRLCTPKTLFCFLGAEEFPGEAIKPLLHSGAFHHGYEPTCGGGFYANLIPDDMPWVPTYTFTALRLRYT